MNRDLMFSSKKDTWCTPQDFFDELDREFHFTLDPCATEKSAKCKKYFTPEQDGLLQSWDREIVFCNPPYGREISKWIKKAAQCTAKIVVMLIPARTDTSYFHDYIYHNVMVEVRFLRGRLKFVNLDILEPRKMSSAPFPSMLVIFRYV